MYQNQPQGDENVVLPSQQQPRQSPKQRGSKKNLKWGVIIFLIVLLYVFYTPLTFSLIALLEQNPTLYSYYLYVQAQISNATLIGLFFFSILGALFFLILPSEGIILYYLASTDHFLILIILFGVAGNAIGMTFNYLVGRLLGQSLLKLLFGELEFYRYKDGIDRYGGYLLLFGNILPGPIEFLSLFYGGFKFSYKRYIYLVIMGRLIKYVLLLIAFIFYWDSIVFFYDEFVHFFKELFFLS